MKNALTILALCSLLGSAAFTRGTVQAQAGRGNASPQEHLNSAADAILKLKSAQFTLTREGAPAFLDEKTGVTFTAAQCSYAAPDRVSCNVKIAEQERNDPATDARVGPRRHVPEQSAHAPVRQGPRGFQLQWRPAVCQDRNSRNSSDVGAEASTWPAPRRFATRARVHLQGRGERRQAQSADRVSTLKPELMYPVDLWMEEQSANPVRIHVTEPAGNGWLIDLFAVNEPVDIPTPKVPPQPPPDT